MEAEEKTKMSVELLQSASWSSYTLALILAVTAIILFFALDIKKLSGKDLGKKETVKEALETRVLDLQSGETTRLLKKREEEHERYYEKDGKKNRSLAVYKCNAASDNCPRHDAAVSSREKDRKQ